MPELPEVETIRRELEPNLVGRRITGCAIARPDIIGHPSPAAFRRGVTGRLVTGVGRRGKYLVIEFEHGWTLVFHLRLSGAMFFKSKTAPRSKYPRLVIGLAGHELVFDEPRVLGRAYLLGPHERPSALKGFYNLGREPVCEDFNTGYFKDKVKRRKAPIKNILLDQAICAGIGNIYADEALFRSGIRPSRRANTLSGQEIGQLAKNLKQVLLDGIKHCGTTVSDYKRSDGRAGNFQRLLNVYGREGEPCRACGAPIKYIRLGNRGTRYCPECQK